MNGFMEIDKSEHTYKYKSEFLKILDERGFIKQCTNTSALDTYLSNPEKHECIGYIGFDCTAKSLHVGSLLQIMLLRLFQKCGHTPIILMGSATTRIGDPSDKTEMRSMLSDEEIEKNKESIKTIFEKFLDFSDNCSNKPIMVDNADWLKELKYLDFLRDYGTHFTINRMLTFDSVKIRLDREQPLTFLEFNYMLLQAYDFVELNKRHNCALQFGGSDQWGNIVNGVDLGRRLGRELYGITTNIIENSEGKKMGKTAQGAVWLNSSETAPLQSDTLHPHRYWQFWRNTNDNDVIKFLKIYTDLPIDEIRQYESLEGEQLNEAKILLADEATKLCHGDRALETVRTMLNNYELSYLRSHSKEKHTVTMDELETGIMLYKLLVRVNLCKSGNEAKDLIMNGGIEMNGKRTTDPYYLIQENDFQYGEGLLLMKGKKGKNMEWTVVEYHKAIKV